MFQLVTPSPAVFFSLQPPCVFHTVRASVAEQGDDVTVLNGCQEEHKTSSAKVQHTRMHTDI